MRKIVLVINSLFEYVKKDNNDMISDIKDLREETKDFISNVKVDNSSLEKKVNCLNVEIDNVNQY